MSSQNLFVNVYKVYEYNEDGSYVIDEDGEKVVKYSLNATFVNPEKQDARENSVWMKRADEYLPKYKV